MKLIQLLIIGLNVILLLCLTRKDKEYYIYVDNQKYPIEDYWKIANIELDEEKVEVVDYESVSETSDKLIIKKEGRYKFTITSIFADSVINFVVIDENNKNGRIVFPEFKEEIQNYKTGFITLFEKSKKVQIFNRSLGCFGLSEVHIKIEKNKTGGLISVESNLGENKYYKISNDDIKDFENSLNFEKKEEDRWSSTNREHWYFKIGNQIVFVNEKEYDISGMKRVFKKIME